MVARKNKSLQAACTEGQSAAEQGLPRRCPYSPEEYTDVQVLKRKISYWYKGYDAALQK